MTRKSSHGLIFFEIGTRSIDWKDKVDILPHYYMTTQTLQGRVPVRELSVIYLLSGNLPRSTLPVLVWERCVGPSVHGL